MQIDDILSIIYDKNVGWRPVSGSIKPVHVANGLFRDLLDGQHYSIKDLLAFVVPYKNKNSREPHDKKTYKYLVRELSDPRYAAFKEDRYKEKFEQLRDYAMGLISADKAVFPEPTKSSLTLTCHQMITDDYNDREVGRYMAQILRGKEGNGKLGQLVKELLQQTPTDPISVMFSPLLSRDPKYSPIASDKCSPYDNENLSGFFNNLEKAADCLYSHEVLLGNRLTTLQRVVHFACLSLLSHAQMLSANGKQDARVPFLLVMDAPKGSSLAKASEQTLILYYEAFENWLAEQLAARITNNEPIVNGEDDENRFKYFPKKTKESVKGFFSEEILGCKGAVPDRDLVNSRMSIFEQSANKFCPECAWSSVDDKTWTLILADALVQCYVQEYESSGGPEKFLKGLGRQAGIIYPHFQGRSTEKRFKPSVSILDLLVRSCCPAEETMPLPAFLKTLWETYGIIVGGRTGNGIGDHELLANIRVDISQNDLEANVNEFVEHLVQIGLARRYPDNISYIGNYNA